MTRFIWLLERDSRLLGIGPYSFYGLIERAVGPSIQLESP